MLIKLFFFFFRPDDCCLDFSKCVTGSEIQLDGNFVSNVGKSYRGEFIDGATGSFSPHPSLCLFCPSCQFLMLILLTLLCSVICLIEVTDLNKRLNFV